MLIGALAIRRCDQFTGFRPTKVAAALLTAVRLALEASCDATDAALALLQLVVHLCSLDFSEALVSGEQVRAFVPASANRCDYALCTCAATVRWVNYTPRRWRMDFCAACTPKDPDGNGACAAFQARRHGRAARRWAQARWHLGHVAARQLRHCFGPFLVWLSALWDADRCLQSDAL